MSLIKLLYDLLATLLFNPPHERAAIARALETRILARRQSRRPRKRRRNKLRNRGSFRDKFDGIDERLFRRMFRMTRDSFYELLHIIEPYMKNKSLKHGLNSSGSVISKEMALAVTLRWMAGASYLDLCYSYDIALGTFHSEDGPLWATMEAIDKALNLSFPVNNVEKLTEMARGFARFSLGRLMNCVMAVDGWVLRTRAPTLAETNKTSLYWNRHNCYGMVTIAGCDSNLRFHMFSMVSSGSTNDHLAYDFSSMKNCIEERLPDPFYCVADEGLTNSRKMLTPWSRSHMNEWRSAFNWSLSRMRQCIERAFSHLVERWGIFQRPLRCAMKNWTLVGMVGAKLHNYCIDQNEAHYPRYRYDINRHDNPEPLMNPLDPDDPPPRGNPDRGNRNTREVLTQLHRDQGWRRPWAL